MPLTVSGATLHKCSNIVVIPLFYGALLKDTMSI